MRYINGGSPATEKAKFSMQLLPIYNGKSKRKGTFAVYLDDYKMVKNLDSEEEKLYNFKKDRQELENIVDKEPDIAARLRGLIMNFKDGERMNK